MNDDDLKMLNKAPYLLSDDELVAMVENEYELAGKPVDEISKSRNWKAIADTFDVSLPNEKAHKKNNSKTFKKGYYQWLSILAVAGILLFILPIEKDEILTKSGHLSKEKIALAWSGNDIQLSLEGNEIKFGALVTKLDHSILNIWTGTFSKDVQIISTPVDEKLTPICLVYGDSQAELDEKLVLVRDYWESLSLDECLSK